MPVLVMYCKGMPAFFHPNDLTCAELLLRGADRPSSGRWLAATHAAE
ncbi:MAG TPA: hypothetical protein VFJ58_14595 [Armatimonadota bacterium]|nr:hypothetical protein [Armatimonadota bacterium]